MAELKKEKMSWKKKLLIGVIFFILFCGLLLLYSRYIGTRGLKVREYKITNELIPDSFHGVKVVHFSDLHYGRTINQKELKKIVKKINNLNPDIVIFTGDLIDKDVKVTNETIKILEQELKTIKSNIGKYAVTGNHDYLVSEYEAILESSDFVNLNENYDIIYNESYEPIYIAGISTYMNKDIDDATKVDKANTYFYGEEVNTNYDEMYKILVMHEPDSLINFNKLSPIKYNLILAGHSHNGQVRLPFLKPFYTPIGSKTYYEPYYKVDNSDLYISSGIGTSNLNFRFFVRPSINLYRLTNY